MTINFEAIPPTAIAGLLQRAPKAELHMHIEGSLEPEMIFELARKNGVQLPYADAQALRSAYAFTNLQSFLDIYHAGTSVLKDEGDFYTMAMAYFERAAADHVVRAEVFFDTQTYTERGLPISMIIMGLQRACADAQKRWGLSAGLILAFLRHLSEESALETLEQALPYREHLIGLGLASSEVGHPPEKFARVFARGRELGFHVVAHAGEEGPPSYVWQALDVLKVERIDHGVRSIEDPALVQRLAKERIPLTVCPFSNVLLKVFDTLDQHNLPQLLDAGLCVTINSDDPAYFGGYINQNLVDTFAALPQLTVRHAYSVLRNSLEASFASVDQKQQWLAQLDLVFVQAQTA